GFPFRRFRLYQILSALIPGQSGLPSRLLGRSDVSNLSGSGWQFLIGLPAPNRIEFGHAEIQPRREIVLWFVVPLLRRRCYRRTVTAPWQPEELY
ncbi:hypothetical protein, partial [Streptomyces hayashii]|uniref:hypothetical protein n=1 Tax=Streptomyces hayashii TaxID=2839966 RepID=UPI00403D18B6